jgi:hypothetical protein
MKSVVFYLKTIGGSAGHLIDALADSEYSEAIKKTIQAEKDFKNRI